MLTQICSCLQYASMISLVHISMLKFKKLASNTLAPIPKKAGEVSRAKVKDSPVFSLAPQQISHPFM